MKKISSAIKEEEHLVKPLSSEELCKVNGGMFGFNCFTYKRVDKDLILSIPEQTKKYLEEADPHC